MPLTSEFFYKHPGDKAGYRHQCKPCGNMARKAWLKKNPAKHRSTRIKLVYGLDAFAHAELLSKQDGKCAVCLKPESDFKRRFAVDHDHKTGKVRGLLCGNCNTAIGLAKDDPELLNLLASYLRKQSGPIQTQGV